MRVHTFFVSALVALIGLALVARVGYSVTYDPVGAVDYARKYAFRVVSDGYFYVNSYPATYYGAGTPVPSGGYDCAHFVSSCIGDEEHEQGGGLDVPDRAGTYGEPGADRLCDWLINGSGVGQEETSVNDLTAGDVIGYDWNSNGWIDHVTLYLGNGLIASHSSSRLDYPWDYNGDNFTPTFVHIVVPVVESADFDGDGDVDANDFLWWQIGFGDFPNGGAQKSDGDYDNDGDVDGDDFLGWQAEFGSGSGSASAAVPEPSSVVLLFALLIGTVLSTRRF